MKDLLDERDEYFRMMADAMPHMVWTTDPSSGVDYLNQPWVVYTGMSIAESLGMGWLTVVHPDDRIMCLESRDRAYGRCKQLDYELRIRRADGEYRWHMVRALPMFDRIGNLIKYVGSSTDIHDTKLSQLALQDTVAQVERQVKERTAELLRTNMELIDAIAQRRRAMADYERDAQRLNEIMATQALLMEAKLEPSALLELAVEKIAYLTSATGAALELIDRREFVRIAASGQLSAHIGLRFPAENSLTGLCIVTRSVLVSDDTLVDTRVNQKICRMSEIASLVAAPLFHRGHPVGVVKIVSRNKKAFGERDVQTLRLMAGLIGAALAQHSGLLSTERIPRQAMMDS